jgi:hypothetical protein
VQSFLRPVETLLEHTQTSEGFQWSDFLHSDTNSEVQQEPGTNTTIPAAFPNNIHSQPAMIQVDSQPTGRPPDPPGLNFTPADTESYGARKPIPKDTPLSVILYLSVFIQTVVEFLQCEHTLRSNVAFFFDLTNDSQILSHSGPCFNSLLASID